MKITYRQITLLTLLANLYWLPITIYLIVEKMGPMGFGLLVFPFSVGINLIGLTSGYDFFKRTRRFEVINTIGLIFTLGLSGLMAYFRLTA
jgi:hypothetical protein